MNVLFVERQRFNQPVFWIFLILITGLFAFAFFQQFILDHPFGKRPMSDRALISSLGLLCFVDLLFFNFKLRTTISDEAIMVKLTPFHIFEKRFEWSQLEEVNVRQYKLIKEYGGWGLRGFATRKSIAQNGRWAIELVFPNGQSLLIGTQKPEDAQLAIEKARSNIKVPTIVN
jgi:hypothetical protein